MVDKFNSDYDRFLHNLTHQTPLKLVNFNRADQSRKDVFETIYTATGAAVITPATVIHLMLNGPYIIVGNSLKRTWPDFALQVSHYNISKNVAFVVL